ncbi:MAG: Gfo/Idh/MocA family protein [Methanocella sp.]
MKRVRIGLIGTGFAAAIHAEAYHKVCGVEVQLVACSSVDPRAAEFARRFHFAEVVPDWQELIRRPDLDLVDNTTPTVPHPPWVRAAAAAGKNVVCEKPLSGYFGRPGDPEPLGERVDRAVMLEAVRGELESVREGLRKAGVIFCYAENWVYAPPVTKAKRVLAATGSTILSQRAEEAHSGSHASYAREWRLAGGGSLLRQGAHPVATVIHMKHHEGLLKGQGLIRVKSVVGDVGNVLQLPGVAEEGGAWLATGPTDVEDWASATLTFTDGTKAVVVAADSILGGIRNQLEVFLSRGVVRCNMNPNDAVMLYTPSAEVLGDEYVAEKVETKGGWQYAAPDEDWMRGYPHELQDFVECVAEGREPVSGLELACETAEVVYAAYLSAQEGRRVDLR